MPLLLHVVLLSSLLRPAQAPCVGDKNAPALDHVVLVVHNLDRAAAAFRARGFRIKAGRLHANNLLNRHIKFRDGSSLELMTLAGPPRDDMARDYAGLLTGGESGVYVGLNVPDLRTPERAATELGLAVRRTSSGPWQFLSFPGSSPAAAVFFGAGVTTVQDPDSLTSHQPSVSGLREVWLEGSAGLSDLLAKTGAMRCGRAQPRQGQHGERWGLSRGFLVVVPNRSGVRPRILGVVLQARDSVARAISPLPSFWIDYAR
jgi:hypothetical protein